MKKYLCIDLKSFYASVECVERGLDPLDTNLVVADASRTEKTICLAVTPSMKSFGIPGRARLFEVQQKVNEVNVLRKQKCGMKEFRDSSVSAAIIERNPQIALSYITATPQMAKYIRYSAAIYDIYLKYVSREDIHIYSIDEMFMDITPYLKTYCMTARSVAGKMLRDIYDATGITATVGIGTNMYLAKVAMDIVAKYAKPDKYGTRIAELDEISYREELWNHRPLTDFWRIGKGYAQKLEKHYIFTMGDIARLSMTPWGERLIYKLFGVNAELLIDHAWGWESCEISDIKAYIPKQKSVSSGQVLHCPYSWEEARTIVREMAELLAIDLVDKRLLTNQIGLSIGYDVENVEANGEKTLDVCIDFYGRKIPKADHGIANIKEATSSAEVIKKNILEIYDRIINKNLSVRKINITANQIIHENENVRRSVEQMTLFSDGIKSETAEMVGEKKAQREKAVQNVTLRLHRRFGKNTILHGYNLLEGAMTVERNGQIGGHKA